MKSRLWLMFVVCCLADACCEGGWHEAVVSPVDEQGVQGPGGGDSRALQAGGEGWETAGGVLVADGLDGCPDFFFGAGAFEWFCPGEPSHALIEFCEPG